MKILCIAAFTALWAYPQTQHPSGAKALFFTAKSGKETPATAASPPEQHAHARPAATRSPGTVTGLRYYIELERLDHRLSNVNNEHVFHSGDRIRLHVISNVDGSLVIFQQQGDEPEERLFPSSHRSNATGLISRRVDTVLPSTHSWFVFDEHPGQIRLTLLLIAQSADPKDESDTPTTLQAQASMAHSLAKAIDGSKALRIEIDDSPVDTAEYKVLDSSLDPKLPGGVIATEVTLTHVR